MRNVVADATATDAATVNSLLAFKALRNVATAIDKPWTGGVRTRGRPGPFAPVTAEPIP